jgi:hypothetical protein
MKFYNIQVSGKFINEKRSSAPSHTASDAGRIYYLTSDQNLYLKTASSANKIWGENNLSGLISCLNSCGGLDADCLNGQAASYYTNASNLSSGTVPSGRLSGSYNITSCDSLDSEKLDGQPANYYTNMDNAASGTLAIANGGTNASTAAGARTNLEITGDVSNHCHDTQVNNLLTCNESIPSVYYNSELFEHNNFTDIFALFTNVCSNIVTVCGAGSMRAANGGGTSCFARSFVGPTSNIYNFTFAYDQMFKAKVMSYSTGDPGWSAGLPCGRLGMGDGGNTHIGFCIIDACIVGSARYAAENLLTGCIGLTGDCTDFLLEVTWCASTCTATYYINDAYAGELTLSANPGTSFANYIYSGDLTNNYGVGGFKYLSIHDIKYYSKLS